MRKTHNLLALGLVALLTGSAAVAQAQYGQDAEVLLDGRTLSFSYNNRPYFSGSTVLVPARDMARQVGANFSERGNTMRITYRREDAEYTRFRRDYLLNGRNRSLPVAGALRNGELFLPVELFRDLTDRDIDVRRGDRNDDDWRPGTGNGNTIELRYRGDRLEFGREDASRVYRGTVYLSVRATARQTGVEVRRERGGSLNLRSRGNNLWYEDGRDFFELDGRRVRLSAPSRDFDNVMFVPQSMFQSLLGSSFQVRTNGTGGGWGNGGRPGNPPWNRPGGGYDDRPDWVNRQRVEVYYRGRRLDFDDDEQPFTSSGATYVPFRVFAERLDVRFRRDGERLILTRDGDEIEYVQPDGFYRLNGRRENLRRPGLDVNNVLFVPIELYNVFADGRLEGRRR